MVPPMALQPGLSARVDLVVSGADLATVIGSGEAEVLATPRVVALCEEATVLATAGHLDTGEVTLGTKIELDHLQSSLRVGSQELWSTISDSPTGSVPELSRRTPKNRCWSFP